MTTPAKRDGFWALSPYSLPSLLSKARPLMTQFEQWRLHHVSELQLRRRLGSQASKLPLSILGRHDS